MDDLFLSYRLNLDPELFCACRGERSYARIPKHVSTGVENAYSLLCAFENISIVYAQYNFYIYYYYYNYYKKMNPFI